MAFTLARCTTNAVFQTRQAGIKLLSIRGYVADPSQISDFPEHEKDLPGKVKATIPPVQEKRKTEDQRESTDKKTERSETSRVPPESRKIYPEPHQKRPSGSINAKPWYEENPIKPDLGVSSSPFEDLQKRKYGQLTVSAVLNRRFYSKKPPQHTLDEGIPGPSDPLPPPIPNDPTTQYVVEPSSPPTHEGPPEIPPSPYIPPEKMKIPVSGIPPPRDPPPASAPPEITRPDDAEEKPTKPDQET